MIYNIFDQRSNNLDDISGSINFDDHTELVFLETTV